MRGGSRPSGDVNATGTDHPTDSSKIKNGLLPDCLFLTLSNNFAYFSLHVQPLSSTIVDQALSHTAALFSHHITALPFRLTQRTMSDHVYDWEIPADMDDYRFDLDVDLDQYIDPALLSLHVRDADQEIDPAAYDLRPSDAGQSG